MPNPPVPDRFLKPAEGSIDAQGFLLALSDRLRSIADPTELLYTALDMVGRYLGVNRVGYCDVEEATSTFYFPVGWGDGVLEPLTGRTSMLHMVDAEYMAHWREGRTVCVPDADLDPRVFAQAFAAIGTKAFLAVPLVRDGMWVAALFLNHATVREWTPEEGRLLEGTLARTWESVGRARAEHDLRTRTRERDRIWQHSRDMLCVADSQGVMLSVSPAWTRTLGWRSEDIVGRTTEWMEHPDDHEKTRAEIRSLVAGNATVEYENRLRTKAGDYRTLTWTAFPDEGLFYCVGRDITEERARADALAKSEEALRQSQKMEAIGQLTGGVAHDFNNLLTIIRSSVELLRRPDLPDVRKARYLDAVSDTVARAAKLTGQLLAFARRQSLVPEVFDVGAKLHGVGDMLDAVTGSRLRVAIEMPDSPCFVRADVSQFETALLNMAVNARDAMNGEGRLTLRLARGTSMPSIRGHAASAIAFVAVSVIDTGSGIAQDHLGRIFEPFFTTKEVGKGTGLGLSQVFGFAKQSGGDVDVRSVLGEGTTFTLYLPQVTTAPEAAVPDVDGQPSAIGTGHRVLVVEDNIEVGRFCTQILEDLGYATEWAASAEEALDRLGADGDGFDAVFSDVVMPGMGGVAMAEVLRERLPHLPVVLASGYSHVLARKGDHGFELLHKPYSAEQITRVLRRVIAKVASAECGTSS